MLRAALNSEPAFAVAGLLVAAYGWLLRATNRVVREPEADFYAPFDRNRAVIVTVWHGEHFLVPFLPRRGDRMRPLMTYHRDGEIIARGASYFGMQALRGSGDHGREFMRKKAVQAFTGMLRELKAGGSVIVTADVPKVSRVAGLGIVTLAKHARCPILPLAMTTSRHRHLSNWDKTCINLPFGRMLMVRGDEIHVPADADDAMLESLRQRVETALNVVTERAYFLAGGGDRRA